MFLDKIVLLR